jgi:hypothetical protein
MPEFAPTSIVQLARWKMTQPSCIKWMEKSGVSPDSTRIVAQILRTAVHGISAFTGDSELQVIQDIMAPIHGDNVDILYGLCDEAHVDQLEMIRWAKTYLAKEEKSFKNILDYYGKTGEFSVRAAKMLPGFRVSFIDQNPWFNYLKYRSRLHGVHHLIKTTEATPNKPRPDNLEEHFGLISALEAPHVCSDDWLEWLDIHLIPLGFIGSKAELPWKKVAKLELGFLYQKPKPS